MSRSRRASEVTSDGLTALLKLSKSVIDDVAIANGVVGGLVWITDTARQFKTNREAWKDFSEYTATLRDDIQSFRDESLTSASHVIPADILSLQKALLSIVLEMQQMKKRSLVSRFLQGPGDPKKIVIFRQMLTDASTKFNIAAIRLKLEAMTLKQEGHSIEQSQSKANIPQLKLCSPPSFSLDPPKPSDDDFIHRRNKPQYFGVYSPSIELESSKSKQSTETTTLRSISSVGDQQSEAEDFDFRELNNERVPVIIYPDDTNENYLYTKYSTASIQVEDLDNLEHEFPHGGMLVSIYCPESARSWLDEHSDDPIWREKPPCINVPLPLMLSACIEAFAIFSSGDSQHINFARLLARESGFPVIVREPEEDPKIMFLRSSCDSESGRADSGNSGSSSGFTSGPSNSSSSNDTDRGRSNKPSTGGNEDESGGGSGDGFDGVNGGSSENIPAHLRVYSSWREHPKNRETHTVALTLNVVTGACPPIAVGMRYSYRFATRLLASKATECPISGVPSADNVAVLIRPLTVLTKKGAAALDRSYSGATMMMERNKGTLITEKYIDAGYDRPGTIGAETITKASQIGGTQTIGPVTASFVASYMLTNTNSSLATQEKPCPQWIVEPNGAVLQVFTDSKGGCSISTSYVPSEQHKRHGTFLNHQLEGGYGMSAEIAPPLSTADGGDVPFSSATQRLPCISFVLRNQINIWLAGSKPNVPSFGVTIIQSMYVADIQTPGRLQHYGKPLEVDLRCRHMPASRCSPSDFRNPDGTGISVSSAAFNCEQKPLKLKKPSEEHLQKLPIREHLVQQSELYDPIWRDVLWPSLTKELKCSTEAGSRSPEVFRLDFVKDEVESPEPLSSTPRKSLVPSKRISSWSLPRSKKGKEKANTSDNIDGMDLD